MRPQPTPSGKIVGVLGQGRGEMWARFWPNRLSWGPFLLAEHVRQAVCRAVCQAVCWELMGALAALPGLALWTGDSEPILPASLAAGAGCDQRARPCWALAARDEA